MEHFPLLALQIHELSHVKQVVGYPTWFITVCLLSITVFITKGKAYSSLPVNLHHRTEEKACFDV